MFKPFNRETPFERESRRKRIRGCMAQLENEGWCYWSDLSQIEVREIERCWMQTEDEKQRRGIPFIRYRIRESQMNGIDIWETYTVSYTV